MASEALRLRRRALEIGAAKRDSRREAVDAHLALPLDKRLLATIALCDAFLGDALERPFIDDAAATWSAVRAKLDRSA